MYRPYTLPESLPVETVRGFSADLKGLCEWLSLQNPATEYCFIAADDCLFGRFHKAIGIAVVRNFFPNGGFYPTSLTQMYPGADRIGPALPHTFGAALERARSALREGGGK